MKSAFLAALALALLLAPGAILAAPTITTASPLPAGSLGAAYSQTLAAGAGTAPYTWTVSAGALPAGMTLSSAGVLSGTPTATGVFNFTAQVTDAVPEAATKAFTITVYLSTAANGAGIPYPTSNTTYPVTSGGNTIQVPEGMVYVPAGAFTYGTGTAAASVTLDGYCLNKFEVTNAEWKAFLNATGSTQYPTHWSGGTYPAGKANHPVLYVSLNRANAYAAWIAAAAGWNVVVPSAPQWEKAARGPNAYSYPWGNTQGSSYNSTTGVLTANFNYNGVVSSSLLFSSGSSPAIYNHPSSPYYNQVVTIGTIQAYSTAGVPTQFAVTATGSVNGFIQHDTYTGFVYTDVYDAIVATGGNTTPVGTYESGRSAYGNYDMAGNVYEFTNTQFIATNGEEAGQFVNMVRGGSWYSTGASGRAFDTGEGRNSTGAFHSVGFRIAMLPVPAATTLNITTASPLPTGTSGVAYSQQLAANGGTASFTWTLASGTLPAGLTLSTAGLLSGTPTGGGTANFTVRVTDSGTSTVTKAFAHTVTAAALSITSTSPLPDGVVNAAYSQTLTATGGIAPYTWSLNSGSLPAGLALNTAGVISGTSTATGISNFTVQVTDTTSTSVQKSFVITVLAFGPLHHFAWDYFPASVDANAPVAAKVTARDAAGNLVTSYNGGANLTGTAGTPLASPIVITEVTDETEDQFELQNISGAAVNTTGWYVRIGDAGAGNGNGTLANLNTVAATQFNLPSSNMASGGLLRVTETAGNANNPAGIYYFGAGIAWQNAPSASRGWVALFDNNNTLRDFFIFNWDATNFASFNVTINGTNVTAANCGWNGTPIVNGTRVTAQTYESWQRQGTSDNNSAADWIWRHNADNTNATNFNATNPSGTNYTGATFPGITIPWPSGTPITVAPSSVTFSSGEYLGYLTLSPAASNAVLTAADGLGHTGNSATFNLLAALTDTDTDGIPDSWESANGLNPNITDSSLDSDGDGASNLDEYRAGTDPQNPASRFAIASASFPVAGQFQFTWPGVAGKLYRVRTCPDLATWTPLAPLILATATGPQTVTIATGGAPKLFIQMQIAP